MTFRNLILAPIRLYQRFISPLIAPRCKYYPTCSSYAEQAVREYGVARGLVLAAWRVLRCNPLSDGGLDYLEDQKLFKKSATHRHEHECDHDHDAAGASG